VNGHHDHGEAEEHRLYRFIRNNPQTLKGRFDPDGAQTWMKGVERIFRAMAHMLAEKAKYSWAEANMRFEASGGVVFRRKLKSEFLKKEVEFL